MLLNTIFYLHPYRFLTQMVFSCMGEQDSTCVIQATELNLLWLKSFPTKPQFSEIKRLYGLFVKQVETGFQGQSSCFPAIAPFVLLFWQHDGVISREFGKEAGALFDSIWANVNFTMPASQRSGLLAAYEELLLLATKKTTGSAAEILAHHAANLTRMCLFSQNMSQRAIAGAVEGVFQSIAATTCKAIKCAAEKDGVDEAALLEAFYAPLRATIERGMQDPGFGEEMFHLDLVMSRIALYVAGLAKELDAAHLAAHCDAFIYWCVELSIELGVKGSDTFEGKRLGVRSSATINALCLFVIDLGNAEHADVLLARCDRGVGLQVALDTEHLSVGGGADDDDDDSSDSGDDQAKAATEQRLAFQNAAAQLLVENAVRGQKSGAEREACYTQMLEALFKTRCYDTALNLVRKCGSTPALDALAPDLLNFDGLAEQIELGKSELLSARRAHRSTSNISDRELSNEDILGKQLALLRYLICGSSKAPSLQPLYPCLELDEECLQSGNCDDNDDNDDSEGGDDSEDEEGGDVQATGSCEKEPLAVARAGDEAGKERRVDDASRALGLQNQAEPSERQKPGQARERRSLLQASTLQSIGAALLARIDKCTRLEVLKIYFNLAVSVLHAAEGFAAEPKGQSAAPDATVGFELLLDLLPFFAVEREPFAVACVARVPADAAVRLCAAKITDSGHRTKELVADEVQRSTSAARVSALERLCVREAENIHALLRAEGVRALEQRLAEGLLPSADVCGVLNAVAATAIDYCPHLAKENVLPLPLFPLPEAFVATSLPFAEFMRDQTGTGAADAVQRRAARVFATLAALFTVEGAAPEGGAGCKTLPASVGGVVAEAVVAAHFLCMASAKQSLGCAALQRNAELFYRRVPAVLSCGLLCRPEVARELFAAVRGGAARESLCAGLMLALSQEAPGDECALIAEFVRQIDFSDLDERTFANEVLCCLLRMCVFALRSGCADEHLRTLDACLEEYGTTCFASVLSQSFSCNVVMFLSTLTETFHAFAPRSAELRELFGSALKELTITLYGALEHLPAPAAAAEHVGVAQLFGLLCFAASVVITHTESPHAALNIEMWRRVFNLQFVSLTAEPLTVLGGTSAIRQRLGASDLSFSAVRMDEAAYSRFTSCFSTGRLAVASYSTQLLMCITDAFFTGRAPASAVSDELRSLTAVFKSTAVANLVDLLCACLPVRTPDGTPALFPAALLFPSSIAAAVETSLRHAVDVSFVKTEFAKPLLANAGLLLLLTRNFPVGLYFKDAVQDLLRCPEAPPLPFLKASVPLVADLLSVLFLLAEMSVYEEAKAISEAHFAKEPLTICSHDSDDDEDDGNEKEEEEEDINDDRTNKNDGNGNGNNDNNNSNLSESGKGAPPPECGAALPPLLKALFLQQMLDEQNRSPRAAEFSAYFLLAYIVAAIRGSTIHAKQDIVKFMRAHMKGFGRMISQLFGEFDASTSCASNRSLASVLSKRGESRELLANGRIVGEFCENLFVTLLQHLPVLLREWFSSTGSRRQATEIEGRVRRLSPFVVARELKAVADYNAAAEKDDEFEVTVSLGQVHAKYTKEDDSLEMVFDFPPSYPLKPIETIVPKCVGFSEAQWKVNQLAVISVIRSQDATVLDACKLWREICQKHLDGVELCPICYSLFQGTQIPNLSCPQCHNKFHSICMAKWFKESSKTTCPLCMYDFSIHR